jgi:hypothetical protein
VNSQIWIDVPLWIERVGLAASSRGRAAKSGAASAQASPQVQAR